MWLEKREMGSRQFSDADHIGYFEQSDQRLWAAVSLGIAATSDVHQLRHYGFKVDSRSSEAPVFERVTKSD